MIEHALHIDKLPVTNIGNDTFLVTSDGTNYSVSISSKRSDHGYIPIIVRKLVNGRARNKGETIMYDPQSKRLVDPESKYSIYVNVTPKDEDGYPIPFQMDVDKEGTQIEVPVAINVLKKDEEESDDEDDDSGSPNTTRLMIMALILAGLTGLANVILPMPPAVTSIVQPDGLVPSIGNKFGTGNLMNFSGLYDNSPLLHQMTPRFVSLTGENIIKDTQAVIFSPNENLRNTDPFALPPKPKGGLPNQKNNNQCVALKNPQRPLQYPMEFIKPQPSDMPANVNNPPKKKVRFEDDNQNVPAVKSPPTATPEVGTCYKEPTTPNTTLQQYYGPYNLRRPIYEHVSDFIKETLPQNVPTPPQNVGTSSKEPVKPITALKQNYGPFNAPPSVNAAPSGNVQSVAPEKPVSDSPSVPNNASSSKNKGSTNTPAPKLNEKAKATLGPITDALLEAFPRNTTLSEPLIQYTNAIRENPTYKSVPAKEVPVVIVRPEVTHEQNKKLKESIAKVLTQSDVAPKLPPPAASKKIDISGSIIDILHELKSLKGTPEDMMELQRVLVHLKTLNVSKGVDEALQSIHRMLNTPHPNIKAVHKEIDGLINDIKTTPSKRIDVTQSVIKILEDLKELKGTPQDNVETLRVLNVLATKGIEVPNRVGALRRIIMSHEQFNVQELKKIVDEIEYNVKKTNVDLLEVPVSAMKDVEATCEYVKIVVSWGLHTVAKDLLYTGYKLSKDSVTWTYDLVTLPNADAGYQLSEDDTKWTIVSDAQQLANAGYYYGTQSVITAYTTTLVQLTNFVRATTDFFRSGAIVAQHYFEEDINVYLTQALDEYDDHMKPLWAYLYTNFPGILQLVNEEGADVSGILSNVNGDAPILPEFDGASPLPQPESSVDTATLEEQKRPVQESLEKVNIAQSPNKAPTVPVKPPPVMKAPIEYKFFELRQNPVPFALTQTPASLEKIKKNEKVTHQEILRDILSVCHGSVVCIEKLISNSGFTDALRRDILNEWYGNNPNYLTWKQIQTDKLLHNINVIKEKTEMTESNHTENTQSQENVAKPVGNFFFPSRNPNKFITSILMKQPQYAIFLRPDISISKGFVDQQVIASLKKIQDAQSTQNKKNIELEQVEIELITALAYLKNNGHDLMKIKDPVGNALFAAQSKHKILFETLSPEVFEEAKKVIKDKTDGLSDKGFIGKVQDAAIGGAVGLASLLGFYTYHKNAPAGGNNGASDTVRPRVAPYQQRTKY